MTNDQVQVFRYSKVKQLYDLEVTVQIFQFADPSSAASIVLLLSRAIFSKTLTNVWLEEHFVL